MTNNYKTIEHQLRKYSFEFLKVSQEPLNMLEDLNETNPQIITDVKRTAKIGTKGSELKVTF